MSLNRSNNRLTKALISIWKYTTLQNYKVLALETKLQVHASHLNYSVLPFTEKQVLELR
jgi:hypothetical protein